MSDSGIAIGAEALLVRMAERGIEYVFANAGTDFAPIIEALSTKHTAYPRFVTCPHENLAMAMANGYYRLSGKPAAVMVHVSVGTANAICGLMNMARDNVPVLLCAGRSPSTETGHIASRDGQIQWGQEAFDQGGMLREFVKWDYELRAGQAPGALVDRALDIAMSEPRGPVYLSLPREVLADDSPKMRRNTLHQPGATPSPSQHAIDEAAHLLSRAENPLIITSALGRTAEAVDALAAFSDEFALPVSQPYTTDLNLPTNHPMNVGFEPGAHVAQADVILIINSGVPWIPKKTKLKPTAKVIHMGVDPLVSHHPYREFEADLLVTGDPVSGLHLLKLALASTKMKSGPALKGRRKSIEAIRMEMRHKREQLIASVKDQTPIHPAWLAHCLNKAKAADAIVINELGTSPGRLELTTPLSYLSTGLAGGLGSGLGTALGAKIAAPEREVIACVGDGSYMFGGPVAYHFVSRAERLPTLTIVANNHQWFAVRQSTLSVYPDGAAAKANAMPLQDLNPSPDFEKVIESCGGYGEKVENPAELEAALRRALDMVRSGTQALLNVAVQPGR